MMGQNSTISWTTHTFNPWIGCTKVSPGCTNCYAEALMDKRWGKVKWGPQGTRQKTSDANWRQPIQWNKAAAQAGERHRVFCASLADVFEDRSEVAEWRDQLFSGLIELTPNLDWLVLTKRPERAAEYLTWRYGDGRIPARNLWMGTSVEDQKRADERIPHLLRCPAAVRFLSIEPLLGPVVLGHSLPHGGWGGEAVDWVIVGSESGPGRREMKTEWAESIADQCKAAGVAFFMKQMVVGCKVSEEPGDFPESLRVRQFPKPEEPPKPNRTTAGHGRKARWDSLTEDQRTDMTFRSLKTKLARYGTLVPPRSKVSWKQGWREIGGKRIYFRSRWEYNYAVYLQLLIFQRQIASWEHEPETFWFEGIKRGCCSYLPDFKVTNRDGSIEYHEVKGWMDDRSKTKIKRMKKYHPKVKLIVIDGKWFKANGPKLAWLPGWEKS